MWAESLVFKKSSSSGIGNQNVTDVLRNSPLISGGDDWLNKEKAESAATYSSKKIGLALKSVKGSNNNKKLTNIFLCSKIFIVEGLNVLLM